MAFSAYSAYGLVFSSDRYRTGLGDSAYIEAVRKGALVRIRRGAFCESSHWAGLGPRERYVLKIRAATQGSAVPQVLCGYSAAAIWGMPVLDDWPTDVHIVGRAASGGRSKQGIRRHPVAETVLHVEERDGLMVTGVARTALDVALCSPFAPAIATVDWALWRKNPHRVALESIQYELSVRSPRYGRRHAQAVIGFATDLSDSFGESMTRGVIHELGYPTPELQVRFTDRHGHMDVDYYWRAEDKVGEFDGAAKYLRTEFRANLTPGEVVWREKKREDRLRKQCDGVIRIIWSEMLNPRLLDVQLREFGLRPSARPKPCQRD